MTNKWKDLHMLNREREKKESTWITWVTLIENATFNDDVMISQS
jgi:hypothetical protein